MEYTQSEEFPTLKFIKFEDNVAYLRAFLSGSVFHESCESVNLTEYLLHLKCKSVVIEDNYVDFDFLSEYSEFYSKSFNDYRSKCCRLHFFSGDCLQPIDLSASYPEKENRLQNNYLGFIVVRPIERAKIGRTVLRTPLNEGERLFTLCKSYFPVNLVGHELNVLGLPFQEQETKVSVCATTAIWMATRALSARFHRQPYTTIDIARSATRYDASTGRTFPSQGLDIPQICAALLEMRYEPQIFFPIEYKPDENSGRINASRLIYYYIESEIPVLASIKQPYIGVGHMVVVFGHTTCITNVRPQEHKVSTYNEQGEPVDLVYHHASDWVENYIINDDRLGIYLEMKLIDAYEELLPYGSIYHTRVQAPPEKPYKWDDSTAIPYLADQWKCPIEISAPTAINGMRGDPWIWNITHLIVPFLPDIIMDGSEAERIAAKHLSWRIAARLNAESRRRSVVFRPYCILSNEYKTSLFNRDMPYKVATIIRGTPMSRFVWVVELSTIEQMNNPNPMDRKIFGEIMIDATGVGDSSVIASYIDGNIVRVISRVPLLTTEELFEWLKASFKSAIAVTHRDYLCMSEKVFPYESSMRICHIDSR